MKDNFFIQSLWQKGTDAELENNTQNRNNIRYNILILLVYLIGIILVLQLFNLQILHGEEYRTQSNTRLTREKTISAARGVIYDSNMNVLATNRMSFKLEFYKTNLENDALNETILNMINVLDSYEEKYDDYFPINVEPFEFTISDAELSNWKSTYKLSEDATAEECFNYFKEKYGVNTENAQDASKIIGLRYRISLEGYSKTKALTIAEDVSRECANELSERGEDFSGLTISVNPIREYPNDTLASHVIGYIGKISSSEYETRKDTYNNDDYIGKTGIEYVFEEYLKGTDGTMQVDMDINGQVTGEYVVEEAVQGASVVLTIDSNIQAVAEESLKNNIEKIRSGGFSATYDATGGAVVVMNVKTGEVIAMASYPDFNPEHFVGGISYANWEMYTAEDSGKPLRNKAIQDSYSPGSIFKMITAIAGLESGTITVNDMINDTGVYPKYTNPKCWYFTSYHKGHGYLNVSEAIKHSCNYFFYELADRMGISTLSQYASYFGLGTKTGIELSSETAGMLASEETKAKLTDEKWYPGETLSAAIGQSYNSFTPLQVAKYISILANGGKQIDVTIVKELINAEGVEIDKTEIESFVNEKLGLEDTSLEDIDIEQEYLDAIFEGMKSVAHDPGGTAYNVFKNFNIEVGGKTGSAEAGKYVNAWFAGFAPYDDPEIAVVVMVENGGHGSYTAYVVRDIIQAYFELYSQDTGEDMNANSYTEVIE